MGEGRHPDDPINPPQRHHAEPPHLPLLQRPPLVVPAHQERAGSRQGLVHVPGEHGPHEVAPGIPPSRRYVSHIILIKIINYE